MDASLGTSDAEGKSTTGLALKLFGDPIFRRMKRQIHISLTTVEAEYIAINQTAAINIAKSEESQSLKYIVNLSER